MSTEELLRFAYIESTDPLVLELCKHAARLLDENAEMREKIKTHYGHAFERNTSRA